MADRMCWAAGALEGLRGWEPPPPHRGTVWAQAKMSVLSGKRAALRHPSVRLSVRACGAGANGSSSCLQGAGRAGAAEAEKLVAPSLPGAIAAAGLTARPTDVSASCPSRASPAQRHRAPAARVPMAADQS